MFGFPLQSDIEGIKWIVHQMAQKLDVLQQAADASNMK